MSQLCDTPNPKTIDLLLKIFWSRQNWGAPRGNAEDYELLALYLGLQVVTIEVTRYQWREEPTDTVNRRIYLDACERGGHEHQLLKYQAYRWLKERDAEHVQFEYHRRREGISDVVSEDLGVIVECGCTGPDKAVRALLAGYTFTLFPFNYEGVAFTFTRGARFDVAEQVEQLRLDRIAQSYDRFFEHTAPA